jgi:hypothetical protein
LQIDLIQMRYPKIEERRVYLVAQIVSIWISKTQSTNKAMAVSQAIREAQCRNGDTGSTWTEGWFGADYVIPFNEAEIASASDRYSISRFIPWLSGDWLAQMG